MLDALDLVLIHQLEGAYGHHLDHRDWDAFGALFTDDAVIEYHSSSSGLVERTGRQACVAWFVELHASHPPAHHVTNIFVDPDADPAGPATVHSKFLAPFSQADHHPRRLYGGDYRSVVVRTDAGWQYRHRVCLPRWQLTVTTDDTGPDHRRTF